MLPYFLLTLKLPKMVVKKKIGTFLIKLNFRRLGDVDVDADKGQNISKTAKRPSISIKMSAA